MNRKIIDDELVIINAGLWIFPDPQADRVSGAIKVGAFVVKDSVKGVGLIKENAARACINEGNLQVCARRIVRPALPIKTELVKTPCCRAEILVKVGVVSVISLAVRVHAVTSADERIAVGIMDGDGVSGLDGPPWNLIAGQG